MLVGLTSEFSSALPLATDCGLKPFFVLLTDTVVLASFGP